MDAGSSRTIMVTALDHAGRTDLDTFLATNVMEVDYLVKTH